MPYPVSIKEAVKLENDVIRCIEEAALAGRLRAAVDIMLEYISASITIDVIDDLQDMLADPDDPLPVPRTAEDYKRLVSSLHATPTKEGAEE